MKSISFVIGVLLLALALKPCSDGFNSEHDTITETSTEHSHQNDHDDSCAILCVCNCCGVLIVYQKPATYSLQGKIIISTALQSYYESHYRFDRLFNIWQPPQFV